MTIMYDFPGKSGDATLRITAGGTAICLFKGMLVKLDPKKTGPRQQMLLKRYIIIVIIKKKNIYRMNRNQLNRVVSVFVRIF